jgi:hypothetical protein
VPRLCIPIDTWTLRQKTDRLKESHTNTVHLPSLFFARGFAPLIKKWRKSLKRRGAILCNSRYSISRTLSDHVGTHGFQEISLTVSAAVKPCAFGAPRARLWGLTAPPRQASGHPCRKCRSVPSCELWRNLGDEVVRRRCVMSAR